MNIHALYPADAALPPTVFEQALDYLGPILLVLGLVVVGLIIFFIVKKCRKAPENMAVGAAAAEPNEDKAEKTTESNDK